MQKLIQQVATQLLTKSDKAKSFQLNLENAISVVASKNNVDAKILAKAYAVGQKRANKS